jgi:hypothetical protein
VRELRLHDAESEAGADGDADRRELPEQCRRKGRYDEEREPCGIEGGRGGSEDRHRAADR